jgi:predicted O-methyltransferase YrrM
MIPRLHSDTVGYVWISHAEICRIVDSIPVKSKIAEVGTANGATARLIAKHRTDVHILCIDTFVDHKCEPLKGIPESRAQRWVMNRVSNMNLFVGTLQEFSSIAPVEFDVIFIDADHAYRSVLLDLDTSMKHLSHGGMIFVHDYGCKDHSGVKLAVDEWCSRTGFKITNITETLVTLEKS